LGFAYLLDVLLYPVEELPLVQQAGVEMAVPAHMFTGQEAEGADAVVEVYKDEAVAGLLDDLCAVVVCVAVGGVAAALDVDPDGEVGFGGCVGGLEDVDEEAVFGCGGGGDGLAWAYADGAKL
jgi:hypothetical protein